MIDHKDMPEIANLEGVRHVFDGKAITMWRVKLKTASWGLLGLQGDYHKRGNKYEY